MWVWNGTTQVAWFATVKESDMSILKVNRTHMTVVCVCGAATTYTYNQLSVTEAGVHFPLCNVCNKFINVAPVSAYQASWDALSEEEVMRYVVNQVAHKWALGSELCSISELDDRETLVNKAIAAGHHDLVNENLDEYVAQPVVGKLEAIKQYSKTKKPYLKPYEDTRPTNTPRLNAIKDLIGGKISSFVTDEDR